MPGRASAPTPPHVRAECLRTALREIEQQLPPFAEYERRLADRRAGRGQRDRRRCQRRRGPLEEAPDVLGQQRLVRSLEPPSRSERRRARERLQRVARERALLRQAGATGQCHQPIGPRDLGLVGRPRGRLRSGRDQPLEHRRRNRSPSPREAAGLSLGVEGEQQPAEHHPQASDRGDGAQPARRAERHGVEGAAEEGASGEE